MKQEYCDRDSEISTYFDEMPNPQGCRVPLSTNENSRLKVMKDHGLLDGSSKDLNLDQFTSLCRRLFKVIVQESILNLF